MTRILLFLTLFATAVVAADFMVNSTYNVQFVVIRDPFTNITYTYLVPPRSYLCIHRGAFYTNVNNTLYYFSGNYIVAYAWPGVARFCDSSYTSCYIQRGMVFPFSAYGIVESAPRALYVYNSTTKRWELIFNKRLWPGTLASISSTSPDYYYYANLTFIDVVDNVLKTEKFNVIYYITSSASQMRDYTICLRVNETLFPFYSSLLKRTIVPLYTARRGNVYYVLDVKAQSSINVFKGDGFLFSSAGYFSLINHTTFLVNYYIFKEDFTMFEYPYSQYYYLPVGKKTNGATRIDTYGTYSLEASFFTEEHYAYYLSKPPERSYSRDVYLVGENNTIVVAIFKSDKGMTYASFPLCPIDKIMFYVKVSPYYTVDMIFDRYGTALIQNNSTKTLYILLIESNIYTTKAYKSAQVMWVWRVPPGGATVVPAVAGYYQLLYALDSPCVGEYITFAPLPGYRYSFDGVTFSIVSEGNQAEWIELFKQLLALLSSLHNQTSTVVNTVVLKQQQGYTYSGQSIVNVATSLSSSMQLQNVYAFSIATAATAQGSGMAFGGISVPTITSIALALLLAFTVATGVAKSREDPADRLAAVYAVFIPTVVLLSLFFASDLATAAVIAAVLIALAYAIHAARL